MCKYNTESRLSTRCATNGQRCFLAPTTTTIVPCHVIVFDCSSFSLIYCRFVVFMTTTIYIYIYIYLSIYLSIYLHIHLHLHICIYIYIHTYICIHIYIYIHACVYIYIYIEREVSCEAPAPPTRVRRCRRDLRQAAPSLLFS